MGDDELAATIELVKAKWAAAGLVLRPGVEPERLEQFERVHAARLPADFAQYLLAVDGMEPGATDADLFHFRPLSLLQPAEQALPGMADGEACFVFADWATGTHLYALRLVGSPQEVLLAGGSSPLRVAVSFGDFLAAYARGDRCVHGGRA
jgi:hypothetical protein